MPRGRQVRVPRSGDEQEQDHGDEREIRCRRISRVAPNEQRAHAPNSEDDDAGHGDDVAERSEQHGVGRRKGDERDEQDGEDLQDGAVAQDRSPLSRRVALLRLGDGRLEALRLSGPMSAPLDFFADTHPQLRMSGRDAYRHFFCVLSNLRIVRCRRSTGRVSNGYAASDPVIGRVRTLLICD